MCARLLGASKARLDFAAPTCVFARATSSSPLVAELGEPEGLARCRGRSRVPRQSYQLVAVDLQRLQHSLSRASGAKHLCQVVRHILYLSIFYFSHIRHWLLDIQHHFGVLSAVTHEDWRHISFSSRNFLCSRVRAGLLSVAYSSEMQRKFEWKLNMSANRRISCEACQFQSFKNIENTAAVKCVGKPARTREPRRKLSILRSWKLACT